MTEFLQDNIARLAQTLVVVVGLWLGYMLLSRHGRRFVNRIAAKGGDDTTRGDTLWAMVRRLILIAFVVTLMLMVLLAWGINVGPLLAVGSVIGVALGFGAQDLVRDVIAGFFILAEDQYRIGDVVKIGGVAGSVTDIRPRVTVLRDLDGNVHYVPNGQIEVASNLTSEFAQVVIDVGIAYKEPVDRALEVLGDELNALVEDPDWAPFVVEPPAVMGVERLDDSAVVLRATIKVGASDRWAFRRESLRRIKNRFDAEGIEIPYPHLTIYRGDGEG